MSALRLNLATAFFATLLTACVSLPPTPAPIAGGWSRSGVDDQTRTAATFAAGRIGAGDLTVRRIEAAETQVVAGLNHRLTLVLSDGSRHQVVVWQRLDGTLELTADTPLP
jgi:hypothetical protein